MSLRRVPLFALVAVLALTVGWPSKVRAQGGKPVVRVVTLGHENHGKTTLTAAILKVLAERRQAKAIPFDRLDKPAVRSVGGARVAAAQVEYRTTKQQYRHLDCPAPADYVKLLRASNGKLDGAILVVSAQDGPMPQTREHIKLARQARIPALVVYLNKTDLMADPELLELVKLEIRELLKRNGYPGDATVIVQGSALMALRGDQDKRGKESVLQLLGAMDAAFRRR